MQKSNKQNNDNLIAWTLSNARAKISGATIIAFFTHCFGRINRSKEYAVLGMTLSPLTLDVYIKNPFTTATSIPIGIPYRRPRPRPTAERE